MNVGEREREREELQDIAACSAKNCKGWGVLG